VRLTQLADLLTSEATSVKADEHNELNGMQSSASITKEDMDTEETARDDSPGLQPVMSDRRHHVIDSNYSNPPKMKYSRKMLLLGGDTGAINAPPVKQVSSQGCSRVFIIKGKLTPHQSVFDGADLCAHSAVQDQ
jgi:hypothetical protein